MDETKLGKWPGDKVDNGTALKYKCKNVQDPYSELEEHLALGVDGFFTDFPLTARRFLNYKGILCGEPSNSCPPNSLT